MDTFTSAYRNAIAQCKTAKCFTRSMHSRIADCATDCRGQLQLKNSAGWGTQGPPTE